MASCSRWWFTTATLCCCMLLLSFVTDTTTVICKEINVTEEWTLVGENDTIPAGVHVRIDMTTGEKFVKLVDDEEEENKGHKKKKGAASIDASGNVVVDSSSSSVVVQQQQQQESNKKKDASKEPNYDYDMMYRTLSSLPEDELERMGGLPALNETTREEFESRLKDIWTQRQAELQALHDNADGGLANLPQVLKDRIASIKFYLESPVERLKVMKLDNLEQDVVREDNLVSVLMDLEYQLSDIDMARDFHTLGGWPLLVSLLDDATHHTIKDDDSYQDKINAIQSHASWAIGTMVKNTPEFYPYALEHVNVRRDTALSLVTKFLDGDILSTTTNNNDKFVVEKQQKAMYALGSLLRGNRLAQSHFVTDLDGPSVLLRVFKDISQHHCEPDAKDEFKLCTRLMKRILLLAHDVVTDVVLHPYQPAAAASVADLKLNQVDDQVILKAFTTGPWCLAVLDACSKSNQRDAALTTLQELAPYCQWNAQQAQEAANILKQQDEKAQ